jgi:hypothetical protein
VPIVSAVTAPPFATIHSEHRSKACLAAASAASAASTASDLRACLGAGAPPLALRFILGVPVPQRLRQRRHHRRACNFGDDMRRLLATISLQAVRPPWRNPDNYNYDDYEID